MPTPIDLSRRTFLAGAGAAASLALLAACSAGGGSSSTMKFWNMPWGAPAFNKADRALAESYRPAAGLPRVQYQTVPWANYVQTFSSAVASKTGPAVSSGGGLQAFQFAADGAIAYADDLLHRFKSADGLYDDFLPGTLEFMNDGEHQVAIPYTLDMRPLWYRKSVMDKVGGQIPTSWDEYLAIGKELAKAGVYGFGTGAGTGNFLGQQALVGLMINNGGGLFNASKEPDCVTDRNIEAMDFVRQMAEAGMIDPGSVAYTAQNLTDQWKAGRVGMGFHTPGLRDVNVAGADDYFVASPLAGPDGRKGAIVLIANVMMYKNTPSQEGSEAFLTWYFQHIHTLFEKNLVSSLPVLRSITETPAFRSNDRNKKIIDEWQPISKTFASPGGKLFAGVATVDSTPLLDSFTQTMLQGKTDSKIVLQTLQKGIETAMRQ